jgi:U3 small nucleolar RNA-associated protein 14
MPKRGGNEKQSRIVEEWSDNSDDEEIAEDEAFDLDAERRYGSWFENRDKSNVESSSDERSDDASDDDEELASDDDSDEEGDGGDYMLTLLDKLDEVDDKKEKTISSQTGVSSHIKESEFSSSVLANANLTLDSLMEGLDDTKGFGTIQKQLKKVAQGSATPAPLARVISNRAQRQVHYKDQSQDVSQWLTAVQQNRQAETLDFRPKERLEMTQEIMVEKFVPMTDYEKQIHEALLKAGQQDEEDVIKSEEAALQDDLGSNEITLEEFKRRRGHLAKMRALLFYHEQKRHHIKKIKSKKYRRIRKKQRERAQTAELEAHTEENPDLARELEEKDEMERMKERMTLAHKNTSKWAKRVLKRGKNVDVDTRRALSAQVKRGDDLLKRMTSTKGDGSDDDSDEDLMATARKVLTATDVDGDAPLEKKGLFALSFMQKGVERQRQQAREEARQLLMELEEEARDDYDKVVSENVDVEESKQKPMKASVASKEEMKGVLGSSDLVAKSLQAGNFDSMLVSGNISIDMDNGETAAVFDSNNLKSFYSVYTAHFLPNADGTNFSSATNVFSKAKKEKTNSKKDANINSADKSDSNPWLARSEQSNKDSSKGMKASADGHANKKGLVDVVRAVDILKQGLTNERTTQSEKAPGASLQGKEIISLTQEELVRRAFASLSEKDADEEFDKEKEILAEREDPTRKRKKEKELDTVAGWGSWTGKGAAPPKPPRSLPKHLQPPVTKLTKRKRVDDTEPNVIISERRIKKTAAYMLSEVPYPFTSREEYERAMAGGVGKEWNVTSSFKDMTRPEVITRPGKIIQPLSKKVKQHRAAAKF